MSDAAAAPPAHVDGTGGFGERADEGGFAQRALAWIEKGGNKVPHPAILFLALCIGVIVLSQILDWLDLSVTSQVAGHHDATTEQSLGGVAGLPYDAMPDDAAIHTETFEVKGLLTGDGIRFMFT